MYRKAIDRYQPRAPADTGDTSYVPHRPYSFGSLEGYGISARVLVAVSRKPAAT